MARHAILVIDMLNDFARPDGALYCEGATIIIPRLQELFRWVRERRAEGRDDIHIVHIQEAHRKNDADFKVRPRHAVAGTWGSRIIEELTPVDDEYVVPKRRHSAFAHTDLELYLREENIDTVIVTGTWTNVCVRSTATDALARAFKVITLSDCVHSKTQEMHEYGLNDLSIFTKVMTTAQYIEAWEKGLDPWTGGGDVENKVR